MRRASNERAVRGGYLFNGREFMVVRAWRMVRRLALLGALGVWRRKSGLTTLALTLALASIPVWFKFAYYYCVDTTGITDWDSAMIPLETRVAHDLNWEAIGGFLGMVIAGVAVLVGLRDQTRQEQSETYQQLELASIDLFRWEVANLPLVQRFWENPPKSDDADQYGPTDAYACMEYGCQALNLFEMAVRLHQTGGMPDVVLGSWAAWMWDFTEAKWFQENWTQGKTVRRNYVGTLRLILDEGEKRRRGDEAEDPDPAERRFYHFMGGVCGSRAVAAWKGTVEAPLDDAAVTRWVRRGEILAEAGVTDT